MTSAPRPGAARPTRATVLLNARGAQTHKAVSFKRTLPGEAFLFGELIATEGFLDSDRAAAYGGHYRSLATDHPSPGVGGVADGPPSVLAATTARLRYSPGPAGPFTAPTGTFARDDFTDRPSARCCIALERGPALCGDNALDLRAGDWTARDIFAADERVIAASDSSWRMTQIPITRIRRTNHYWCGDNITS